MTTVKWMVSSVLLTASAFNRIG